MTPIVSKKIIQKEGCQHHDERKALQEAEKEGYLLTIMQSDF